MDWFVCILYFFFGVKNVSRRRALSSSTSWMDDGMKRTCSGDRLEPGTDPKSDLRVYQPNFY